MDGVLTEDLYGLSLDELVERGRAVEEQALKAAEDAELQKQIDIEREKWDLLEKVKTWMPASLYEYTKIERLGRNWKEKTNVIVHAPGLAPLRFYLQDGRLENGYGISVLDHMAKRGDEGWYFGYEETFFEDLLPALAFADEKSGSYAAAIKDVEEKNQHWSENIAARAEEARWQIDSFRDLRDLLQEGMELWRKGKAETAHETAWMVMAGALVQISSTLQAMNSRQEGY